MIDNAARRLLTLKRCVVYASYHLRCDISSSTNWARAGLLKSCLRYARCRATAIFCDLASRKHSFKLSSYSNHSVEDTFQALEADILSLYTARDSDRCSGVPTMRGTLSTHRCFCLRNRSSSLLVLVPSIHTVRQTRGWCAGLTAVHMLGHATCSIPGNTREHVTYLCVSIGLPGRRQLCCAWVPPSPARQETAARQVHRHGPGPSPGSSTSTWSHVACWACLDCHSAKESSRLLLCKGCEQRAPVRIQPDTPALY